MYQHAYGGKDASYEVRFDLTECPVSFIEDGAAELVTALERAKRMHDNYGAPISDKPLHKWPGKLVEALELIEQCRVEEHNARVLREIEVSRQK